jgi:hypothetical protein
MIEDPRLRSGGGRHFPPELLSLLENPLRRILSWPNNYSGTPKGLEIISINKAIGLETAHRRVKNAQAQI